jgi:hypothetical protein
MGTRSISAQERDALESIVGPDHELLWFSDWDDRVRWAKVLWMTAGLRLRMPEAFEVHKRVIQWGSRFSSNRLPDQALGVDKFTIAMMRWAMSSWTRMNFLNTWLGATIAPRIQMDLIPALACAAHVVIVARRPLATIDDYVAGGRAVQRFWLTATSLGLVHQPAIAPLIFDRYVRERQTFTSRPECTELAHRLAAKLNGLLAGKASSAVWLGRIGGGASARSRSERLPLKQLLLAEPVTIT